EQAMGRTIEAAASELEAFAQRNDARAAVERAEGLRILEHLPQTAPPVATTANAQHSSPASTAAAARASQVPAPAAGATGQDTPPAPNRLTGQVMTEERRTTSLPPTPAEQAMPVLTSGGLLWPAGLFFLLLLVWRWRDRREAIAMRPAFSG